MILYIDDDEHYGWLVKTLLSLQNLAVETAYDGLEGMRKARELRPDLILLNLYLPRIDGVEVIQQLRDEAGTRNIPIVVLSALPKQHGRRLVQGLGVQDILSKPFQVDELISIVHEYVHRRTGATWHLQPAGAGNLSH
jgi:two-component system alkaline phosphatase synthesis response regulator PhoP